MTARVGVVGGGSIGTALAGELVGGRVQRCSLQGRVVSRREGRGAIARLAAECDVLVEAAGVDSVADCVRAVEDADCALVVCSTGAFADPELERWYGGATDRVTLPSGAIGGLDLLAALARADDALRVRLTTTKTPAALGVTVDRATTVFTGSAREAIARFPRTSNVGVTLGLATAGLDATEVVVVADPAAARTRHVVEAAGSLGSYRFEIDNAVADGSGARTSALTVWSALVAVERAALLRHVRTTTTRTREVPAP